MSIYEVVIHRQADQRCTKTVTANSSIEAIEAAKESAVESDWVTIDSMGTDVEFNLIEENRDE